MQNLVELEYFVGVMYLFQHSISPLSLAILEFEIMKRERGELQECYGTKCYYVNISAKCGGYLCTSTNL